MSLHREDRNFAQKQTLLSLVFEVFATFQREAHQIRSSGLTYIGLEILISSPTSTKSSMGLCSSTY